MAQFSAALRPFGRVQDMELEFADQDRPRLVTTLLACCCEAHDSDFWWGQTVATRTAALLNVLALSDAHDAVSVTLRCPHPTCELFEVALPYGALASVGLDGGTGAMDTLNVPVAGARTIRVRRPTGNDLRTWRNMKPAPRQESVRVMLDTLVVEGEVSAGDEMIVAEAMAAHDPLVAFAVSCACPTCGNEGDFPVDLETLALTRLRDRQRALLREIHALASKYGWTESEILGVSPARRARYLSLIGDGS